ncbi:MAG: hypothetical protein IPL10_20170 [Bacteroidetes bacterium]|nr:hypothetical protein [Bacteroidota bacterium]
MAGGPIQSIATLTKQLGNDIDFKITTTDRDFKSNKPYDNVKVNEWTNFEGRDVFYVSPENDESRICFEADSKHSTRFHLFK